MVKRDEMDSSMNLSNGGLVRDRKKCLRENRWITQRKLEMHVWQGKERIAYFARNELLVPRWSKSWHKQAMRRASCSRSEKYLHIWPDYSKTGRSNDGRKKRWCELPSRLLRIKKGWNKMKGRYSISKWMGDRIGRKLRVEFVAPTVKRQYTEKYTNS